MSDPIVNEIKEKLDIVDIIGHYVPIKKSGANYKGNCPFHHEKTASFMVNQERQLFRCFGCGESGDVFAFVMKQENIDFPAALELLASKAGVTLPDKKAGTYKTTVNKADLYKINATAAQFFHQVLTKHPSGKEALNYLLKRGLSDDSIKKFQIGYAPSKNEPLRALFTKQHTSYTTVQQAGSPDRFRDRIMFPFRDIIGNIIGFSGRATKDDQQPKYLNTAETTIFHKNNYLYGLYYAKRTIGTVGKIMLVEGQLDLILAHQIGTDWAVATSGTALTEEHLRLMRRYSDTLYLALDADDAGQKATLRGIQMALPHGFEVHVLVLPKGTDPGEIIAKQPETWHKAVAQPKTAIAWLFDHFFGKNQDKPSSTERDQIFNTLFPYISKIKDPVSRNYTFQHLALLLGLQQTQPIEEAFSQWQNTKKPTPSQPVDQSTSKLAPDLLSKEKSLIELLLVNPQLLDYQQFHLTERDFLHPALAQLYTKVQKWYTNSTDAKQSQDLLPYLEQQLDAKNRASLQKMVFDAQTYTANFTPETFLHEYTILIQAMRKRLREDRIHSLAQEIAEAEAAGDRAKVMELVKSIQGRL